ncbi:hypothetical protein Bpfe_003681 [Biomphalaria pfeifferi]|uniref:Uncharacterized protein n=1 Tax=Biomphalaria pfeifferi TaxID=112525 RepID=A0AAD8C5W7_BIOPF|nr:hypothetical protein Bpfe_003681 [Biomphalaria pfeifferi]
MYMCIPLVYMLLFIDILAESTMSPTLTLDKEEFFEDCELWSPSFKDKLLCFGGNVSFFMSSLEIGEAVHINVTSADSQITKMIAFNYCGQLSLKTKELEEIVCGCTSVVGNKSFTYLCAMTFNTSYSGSIINAFLEDIDGIHVQDLRLKLPAINKEESTSIPESNIPQIKQLENLDKHEKVYIGIIVFLVVVIVILTICCIRLRRENRRLVAQDIQAKEETLTRSQAGSEKGMQQDKNRDYEVTEVKKESRKMSGAMQNSRAKNLKSMSNDSEAAHKLGLMEESKTNSTLIPLIKIILLC